MSRSKVYVVVSTPGLFTKGCLKTAACSQDVPSPHHQASYARTDCTDHSKMPEAPPASQTGTSDPVTYTCTCGQPGSVLLFYRYFGNEPRLPDEVAQCIAIPEKQAEFHHEACTTNDLTGKIRVSEEGFNVTVAGSQPSINAYIAYCISNPFFAGLDLSSKERVDAFFKPTPGCKCVFTHLNVRITSEITPLGVTSYSPSTWSAVRGLSPAEFHQKCLEEDVRLVDVRNHYESRIGYFVSPKGGETIKPPIRRFSQWPQWVREHASTLDNDDENVVGRGYYLSIEGYRC